MTEFQAVCNICLAEVENGCVRDLNLLDEYTTVYCCQACCDEGEVVWRCSFCQQIFERTEKLKNRTICKVCAKFTYYKSKYKISKEEFVNMRIHQNFQCAICKTPEDHCKIVMDHCHSTGKVRGLLCSECNIGLGMLRDSQFNLRNAIDYLDGII